MSDLPFVAAGQSPLRSAGKLNALIAAGRANAQQAAGPAPQTPPRSLPYDQNTQILVRNDSNFEFDRYAVVGLDEAIWPPADDARATESFLNEPIISIRPPEACRHWGRWAVLVQPLGPGQVGRAVMSGGVNAFVHLESAWPRIYPVHVDIDLTETGEEYHTTQYGRRRRDGLKEHEDGSAQVLWTGRDFAHHSYANTCLGSVDIECEPGGTAYMITRDSCGEGCSAWAAIDAYAVPCTPGTEHLGLECRGVTGDSSIPHRFGESNPEFLATVRMGNQHTALTTLGCDCRSYACRSECVADQPCNPDGCEYPVVEDVESPTGYTYTAATDACGTHCRCLSVEELIAAIGQPTGEQNPINNPCSAEDNGWHWYVVQSCDGDLVTTTSGDPSTTTTTGDPSTTTTTSAAPQCACPDLNTLAATWPELYPCGPDEAVKAQTHFCYTTTTTSTSTSSSSTTSTSTSSTSTTEEPTSTTSTSTSSTSTTEEPTTTTSTTQGPCPGTCEIQCEAGHLHACDANWTLPTDCGWPPDEDGCGCPWGYFAAFCIALGEADPANCFPDPYVIGTFACFRDGDPPPTTPEPPTTTTTTAEPTSTTTSGDPTSSTTTSGEPTSSSTTEEPTSTTSGEPTSSSTTSGEPTSSTTTTAPPDCGAETCTWLCQSNLWVISSDCPGAPACLCPGIVTDGQPCDAGHEGNTIGETCAT